MHKKNILNTIEYLLCLREVLSQIIPSKKHEIINEYSDYEILFLTKYGKLPKNKNNFLNEKLLIEDLKILFVYNTDFLNEVMKESEYINLFDSLEPLSKYNLSSSKQLLENISTNDFRNILNEAEQPHQYAWKTDPNTGEKLLVDMTANKIIKRVPKDTDKEEMKRMLLAATTTLNTAAATISSAQLVGNAAKGAVNAVKNIPANVRAGVAAVKNIPAATKSTIATIKNYGKSGSQIVGNIVSKVGAANLGYAALAAAAIYGGHKLYKDYLTKEGRACHHLSGDERQQCERKIRTNGLRTQISDLRRSQNACNKTKDPVQCKMVINNKIRQIQDQIAKM